MKPHLIRQDSPALYNTYHWQTRSTPLGCGHFGVSLYGGVGAEMLDLCDNSMWTGGSAWINNRLCSGNEVLGTVKLDFCKRPDTAEDYERLLDLEQGISTVRYRQDGVTYTRRAFVSYPDRVCVLRVEADREGEVRCLVSFSAFARPHLLYGGDGCGRTVTLSAHAHTLSAEGVGEYFALPWGAVLSVVAEGKDASVSAASHHRLEVQNADALVVYLTVGTGYTLCPQVFTEPDRLKKLPPVSDLLTRLTDTVRAAEKMGYDRLLCRHLEDVCPRLSAMTLDLGGADDGRAADPLGEGRRRGALSLRADGGLRPLSAPVLLQRGYPARLSAGSVEYLFHSALDLGVLVQHQRTDELLACLCGGPCGMLLRL